MQTGKEYTGAQTDVFTLAYGRFELWDCLVHNILGEIGLRMVARFTYYLPLFMASPEAAYVIYPVNC